MRVPLRAPLRKYVNRPRIEPRLCRAFHAATNQPGVRSDPLAAVACPVSQSSALAESACRLPVPTPPIATTVDSGLVTALADSALRSRGDILVGNSGAGQ